MLINCSSPNNIYYKTVKRSGKLINWIAVKGLFMGVRRGLRKRGGNRWNLPEN